MSHDPFSFEPSSTTTALPDPILPDAAVPNSGPAGKLPPEPAPSLEEFDYQFLADPGEGQRWSTWSSVVKGARARIPARPGWSPPRPPSTPSSACSRPARKPTSTSSSAPCPAPRRPRLLAAKRYRDAEHRLFHRDAGYLEGRRIRRPGRPGHGHGAPTSAGSSSPPVGGQPSSTRSGRLWSLGIAVPYPVQLDGSEVLMEFIGARTGSRAAAGPGRAE